MSSEIYFTSFEEAARESAKQPVMRGQLHHIRKAFDALEVDGILCVDGRPTVYFKDFPKPLSRAAVNEEQRRCWNQGTATVLVLRDPQTVYLLSGLIPPNRDEDEPIGDHAALIRDFKWSANVLGQHRLVESIASGYYYREHQEKFFEKAQTVDHFLVAMLGELAGKLNTSGERADLKHIHAFLGRLIFACYLIDRKIISLADYDFIRKKDVRNLAQFLESCPASEAVELLFEKLFPALKKEFNGSTFEGHFEEERKIIGAGKVDLLLSFFKGEDMNSAQMNLAFWVFDFSVIPVETISAIYEKFLESEDLQGKNEKGAFYTPRHLAELVVAETVDQCPSLLGKRFLDPSCGSGIFLVILFNRLAEEWMIENPDASFAEQIRELPKLFGNLRGVDVNATACRITCFSLYIALLDQFLPRDLKRLKTEAGLGKRRPLLPELLVAAGKRKSIEFPTVVEGNYFDPQLRIDGKFDFIVGNPPWVSRKGSSGEVAAWMKSAACPVKGKSSALTQDQIALAFLWKVPGDLAENGTASLLLPSQLILNKSDSFQSEWFRRFSVSRLLQLADFRRFLFENAIRPCFVLRFHSAEPKLSDTMEYIVPKVTRNDPRTGLIVANAEDRKFVRLEELLAAAGRKEASLVWKTRLWGTHCDLKLIDCLSTLPKLGDHAGTPKQGKRWVKRQGFQPWCQAGYDASPETYGEPKQIGGSLDDPFVKTEALPEFFLEPGECSTLRERLSSLICKEPKSAPEKDREASLEGFRRRPSGAFNPPMVLVNNGFTRFAYVDFKVFYQDSLTGIQGKANDMDLLLFLVALLRSKLARYYLFHTSSYLGIERDKVEVHELLRLPFPIIGENGFDDKDARGAFDSIVSKTRATKQRLESLAMEKNSGVLQLRGGDYQELREEMISQLEEEIEPQIYRYFGLSEDDVSLVEDTFFVSNKSYTPVHPYDSLPTLAETKEGDRNAFAASLCGSLNRWIQMGSMKNRRQSQFFAAEHVCLPNSGLAVMILRRSLREATPKKAIITPELTEAVEGVMRESSTERGAFSFRRNILHFGKDAIYIVRPDLLVHWTRTAGLNTAEAIYGSIVSAKTKPIKK
ncbi:class I SAM-dependent DNA methyltransferase [Luteolibacter sp. Populi]|uniref:HsdM family class I SAM-dependent methyltransferase n=1 Tax=Luteolibacter sp. Populi TaxID=3230487 RepID=UPI0034658A9A